MGVKTIEARMSGLNFDGAAPLVLHSDKISSTTAAQNNKKGGLVPWAAFLERLYAVVLTAATATGFVIPISLSNTATTGSIVNAANLSLDANTGLVEINLTATDGTVPNRNIPAGTFVEFNFGISTNTGTAAVVAVTAVLTPRSSS